MNQEPQVTQLTSVSANEATLLGNKNDLAAQVKAIAIVDTESCERAVVLTKNLQALKRAIEKDKEELYRPAKDLADKISARYKTALDAVDAAIKEANQHILKWQRDVAAAAEAERQRKQKEADDEALRLAEEAKKAGQAEQDAIDAAAKAEADRLTAEGKTDQAAATLAKAEADKAEAAAATTLAVDNTLENAKTVKAEDTAVRANGAVSSIAKRWTYEVEDISKVPAQFLEINRGAIQAAVRDGERNIPGLRIFQAEGLVIR